MYTIFGYFIGSSLCIFYEIKDKREYTKGNYRIFCWRNGGGINLEFVNSCNGAVAKYGETGICSCGCWILDRSSFFNAAWKDCYTFAPKGIQTKNIDNVQKIQTNNSKHQFGKKTMFVLAIVLHNIPEGMAVGVVYAGLLSGSAQITIVEALTLSLGIAIQNIPEGAIISMPLKSEGMNKPKAFLYGVLSGIVEPIGAVLTILAANAITRALPYLLAFAAGAMMQVVVQELIPELSQGEHSNIGVVFFAVGFTVMMSLDVALG